MEIATLITGIICIVLIVLVLLQSLKGKDVGNKMDMIVEQNRISNQQMSQQLFSQGETLRNQMNVLESNIRSQEDAMQRRTEDSILKLQEEIDDYQKESNERLDEINKIVNEKIHEILDKKLNEAFNTVVKNMTDLGASLSDGQDKQRKEISDQLGTFKDEFSGIRKDNQTALDQLREDNQKSLDKVREEQEKQKKEIAEQLNQIKDEFSGIRKDNQTALDQLREDNQKSLDKVREEQEKQKKEIITQLDSIKNEFAGVRQDNNAALEKLREDNQKSLDKINDTVNEKLQKTLNDRISQSFEAVNNRLAEVYAGLGEMKTVASGVSDLKNVLANVKKRGIVGEIQLSAILDDILTPNQYEVQYHVIPGGREMVDFAVRLPGQEDGSYVYLPIDSKFPGDKWANLAAAYDTGNADDIRIKRDLLEQEIKRCAKSIHDKYICPPYTTDFAILFLPFEGLYAEVVNMGLVESLQRDYQVNITGPSTMAAMLNSLQMGFRTLAIQKKSGEVWTILEAAKKEFLSFGDVLESVKKRLHQADDDLEKLIGTRTRAINRKLKTISKIDESINTHEILELEMADEE